MSFFAIVLRQSWHSENWAGIFFGLGLDLGFGVGLDDSPAHKTRPDNFRSQDGIIFFWGGGLCMVGG